jgi:hypothetical protein
MMAFFLFFMMLEYLGSILSPKALNTGPCPGSSEMGLKVFQFLKGRDIIAQRDYRRKED